MAAMNSNRVKLVITANPSAVTATGSCDDAVCPLELRHYHHISDAYIR